MRSSPMSDVAASEIGDGLTSAASIVRVRLPEPRIRGKGGTTDVLLTFDISDDSTISEPPAITINHASTMSCPGLLTLSATVTDPNSDVDTVRWTIDDHLLAPTVTQVTVPSGNPVFAVVACDSRGACTREEQAITCV
jgi:hypothetical protein